MKIIYRTGNMFAGLEHVLIHGCNAKGVMGSGVARTVRDDFPAAYAAYRQAFEMNGLAMGSVIWATDKGRIIGNAITQESFGREHGTVYVSYEAIRAAMQEIDRLIGDAATIRDMLVAQGVSEVLPLSVEMHLAYALPPDGPLAIAFPLLGAGLGGGRWPVIAEIIESESQHYQPIVYTLDGKVPG